ncbi:hypothetical protein MUG94_02630 [Arthrobacter gengyunqii]|uniref:Uncharacterized protein n=1 Tax=Arthrobacter gengyunqii TaxID=2886940 RepID=A0A9X1S7V6_9MICC|nr:hypothetical protein [Arthrobacter gengyunqii]MCC3267689.1 hypothetical protein [Arthrobacter gengyunqii]MCC3270687.1 hypothetical protein [Arthrobacter gengyunqii]UOY96699.1 hypothetical protein MUG94_02630 [Arthrobacter gengyunqii]
MEAHLATEAPSGPAEPTAAAAVLVDAAAPVEAPAMVDDPSGMDASAVVAGFAPVAPRTRGATASLALGILADAGLPRAASLAGSGVPSSSGLLLPAAAPGDSPAENRAARRADADRPPDHA